MIDRSSMKARSELKYKNILHEGKRMLNYIIYNWIGLRKLILAVITKPGYTISQTVTLLIMQGNEVIVYLQNEYLPSLNVPPHMIQVKFFFFFFFFTNLCVSCSYTA